MRRRSGRFLLSLALAASMSAAAVAQPVAQPDNVVHLNASASVEVPQDWLTVVFVARREGPDAAPVQNQLKQALDAALAEARKAAAQAGAKPGAEGAMEVRTGNFSISPRYQPRGGTSGWNGQAELVVEGRDSAAIAALVGRVQTMNVGQVGWSLSRQSRAKVEDDLAAQAIDAFRQRADRTAARFGFTGWVLREAHVATEGPRGGMPRIAMASRAAGAESMDAPLPVDGGSTTVTATVSGSVRMTK